MLRRSTDDGASWTQAVRIASVGPYYCAIEHLDVLTDHHGRVNVFYANFAGYDSVFCTSSTDDGVTWSPPAPVSVIAYYYGRYGLVLDSLRNIYFFYLFATYQTPADICCRKSTDNGVSWAPPETVVAQNCNDFAVVADAYGCLHISWADDHYGQSEVFYARSTNQGTTWSIPSRMTIGGGGLYWMGMMDSVIYLSYENSITWKTRRRSFDAGTMWEDESDWPDGAHPGNLARAALGAAGRIHLAVGIYSSDFVIAYWRSADYGTTWIDSAVPVSFADGMERFLDDITISDGDVHVVWEDYEAGNYEIYYRRGVGLAGLDDEADFAPLQRYALSLSAEPSLFSRSAVLDYNLPTDADAVIVVRDGVGRLVRSLQNVRQRAGCYRLSWDGRDDLGQPVPAGCYFCTVRAGQFSAQTKLLKVGAPDTRGHGTVR